MQIVNVTNPRDFEKFMTSKEGEIQLLKFLSDNENLVKRLLNLEEIKPRNPPFTLDMGEK